MELRIKNIGNNSIKVKKDFLDNDLIITSIKSVIEVITIAFKQKNRVYFCGNGGSAADAQHLAAEFSGRFYLDRTPLPSEALHCNSSFLTAVANDYGYDNVYSRLLKGIGNKGDILVGISTSGNSQNIINAFQYANEIGMTTVSFTGEDGGKMASLSKIAIKVPSNDTPRIQESHILIGHIICEIVETNLFT
jgi:D-sedoheptulose 7-phosphate isomerase